MDAYDTIFYDSICIPETHPKSLAVLGRLMGVAAAAPAHCRVLELGCATGGNLIPMAEGLPGASLLGIDLSRAQVEEGNRLIAALGLANVRLRQGDILDLDPGSDPALGNFDYVIAHGVYSWVPPPVQGRLLWLARRVLAPNGVLYLSYNVLPGWRMRGALRDILLDACRDHDEPRERLDAAQGALERLDKGLTGLPGEAARYMREEIRRLREAPASYLYFEFLAQHNHPVLFREIAGACERAGLRYLCDTTLHTLFPSSLGDAVESALADIEDGIELEQWIDFLSNRNFRQSLLIRSDLDVDEVISLEAFAGFSLTADLRPPTKPRRRDSRPVYFQRPDGETVQVSHPLTKAVLSTLAAAYPDALPLADLVPEARRQVLEAGGGVLADDLDALLAELFGLFARRAIGARLSPRRLERALSVRPRVRALVRALVEAGHSQVPTRDHGNLDLDPWAARLIGALDGSAELADLAARLEDVSGVGVLGGSAMTRRGPAMGRDGAEARVRGLIGLFQRYGLLEPRSS